MFAFITTTAFTFLLVFNSVAYGHSLYGSKLCKLTSEYSCYVVKRHDTWDKLFSDAREQDIVKRVNRLGIPLEPGMKLAIPRNLATATVLDFAPFPKQISPVGEKMIRVSIDKMAWGAYDAQGTLVNWGPASSARGYCPDLHRGCHTSKGTFAIYNKGGAGCVSTKFPIGRGGAPMPYCMFFHGGFALHGSYEVPGYNASHGCVRLFVNDAKWLNQEFTDEPNVPVVVGQN